MLTRREKLLSRPWQLRRYINHKQKLVNAVSVVDFGPPPERSHVTVKLKKLQKERERQKRIEEDNFILLQHLESIMSKKRVDNYWKEEPITFLKRVNIYHRTRTPSPCTGSVLEYTPQKVTRKSKCLACTPHQKKSEIIPEERIPWAPPRKILTKRQSRSAICPVMSDFDFPNVKNLKGKNVKKIKGLKLENTTESKAPQKTEITPVKQAKSLPKLSKAEQSVIFRQGQLQVVVNYPAFAEVTVIKDKNIKYLQRNLCECKIFQAKN